MNKNGNDIKPKVLAIGAVLPETSDIYTKLSDLHIENEFYILIQNCISQKRDSQKKLYNVFYDYAMSICFRYANNFDDSIEIMNDGFLKIFKKLADFKPIHKDNPIADFKAWLKKIMVFTAIDHFRKNNKHDHLSIDGTTVATYYTQDDNLDKLSYKELLDCVQQLSPGYRTVFSLFVIDGFSHEEIGKYLGIAVGTSKSNLSKARVHLQKMILAKQNFSGYEQRAI